jgi:hypothetical protein
MIAQQVKANGAAVDQLTLRQFDQEDHYHEDVQDSVLFDEEEPHFENVFATKQDAFKSSSSKAKPPPLKHDKNKEVKKASLPNLAMPKMHFPKFNGTNPKVWRDNCESYFTLYHLPEGMWVTAAHLHFEGNTATWYQAYKQNHTFKGWEHFCSVVEEEFGADDYRTAMNELPDLKQIGSVEDYTIKFQSLQYAVTMHNAHYDDMFYTPHYIRGLKEEIRGTVEAQMPTTIHKASIISRVQQGVVERSKARANRPQHQIRPYYQQKQDNKPPQQNTSLWQDRQLRDYRKANGSVLLVERSVSLGIWLFVPREPSFKLMLLS